MYVTKLGSNDVLLGRGTGPSMNEGNINFRMAVEEMKPAYVSTPSRKAKKEIIRRTIKAIKAKNGRFLCKLSRSEIKGLGLPYKVAYEVVPDSIAIEKTKQAIRYIHYKKEPKQGLSGSSSFQTKTSKLEAAEFPKKTPASLRESEAKSSMDPQVAIKNFSNVLGVFPGSAIPGSLLQSMTTASLSTGFPLLSHLSQSVPASSAPFFSSTEVKAENFLRSGGMQAQVGESSPKTDGAATSPPLPDPSAKAPTSSRNLNDALLHSLPLLAAGSPGMSPSLQLGQLQQASISEHLRAVLLADEQYRRLLGSYLIQPKQN